MKIGNLGWAAAALALGLSACTGGGGSSGGASSGAGGSTVNLFVRDTPPTLPPGVSLVAAGARLGDLTLNLDDGQQVHIDLGDELVPLSSLAGGPVQWSGQFRVNDGTIVQSMDLRFSSFHATFRNNDRYVVRDLTGDQIPTINFNLHSAALNLRNRNNVIVDCRLSSIQLSPSLDMSFIPDATLSAVSDTAQQVMGLVGQIQGVDAVAGTITVALQNVSTQVASQLASLQLPADINGATITQGLDAIAASQLQPGMQVSLDGALQQIGAGVQALQASAVTVLPQANQPAAFSAQILQDLGGQVLAIVTAGPDALLQQLVTLDLGAASPQAVSLVGDTVQCVTGRTVAQMTSDIQAAVPVAVQFAQTTTAVGGLIQAVNGDLLTIETVNLDNACHCAEVVVDISGSTALAPLSQPAATGRGFFGVVSRATDGSFHAIQHVILAAPPITGTTN